MNTKKVPLRKCVATNEILPKKELVRIVRSSSGVVFVDPTSKANGHGAYLKLSEEAISKAKKNSSLAKALDCQIPDEIYEELYSLVKKG